MVVLHEGYKPVDHLPKAKRRKIDERKSVEEKLAKLKEYNEKWSKLGHKSEVCMKSKGGSKNGDCNYRGVRQTSRGKWIAKIRHPHFGHKIWLGKFGTAIEAALRYDKSAKDMYGKTARLNFTYYTGDDDIPIIIEEEEEEITKEEPLDFGKTEESKVMDLC